MLLTTCHHLQISHSQSNIILTDGYGGTGGKYYTILNQGRISHISARIFNLTYDINVNTLVIKDWNSDKQNTSKPTQQLGWCTNDEEVTSDICDFTLSPDDYFIGYTIYASLNHSIHGLQLYSRNGNTYSCIGDSIKYNVTKYTNTYNYSKTNFYYLSGWNIRFGCWIDYISLQFTKYDNNTSITTTLPPKKQPTLNEGGVVGQTSVTIQNGTSAANDDVPSQDNALWLKIVITIVGFIIAAGLFVLIIRGRKKDKMENMSDAKSKSIMHPKSESVIHINMNEENGKKSEKNNMSRANVAENDMPRPTLSNRELVHSNSKQFSAQNMRNLGSVDSNIAIQSGYSSVNGTGDGIAAADGGQNGYYVDEKADSNVVVIRHNGKSMDVNMSGNKEYDPYEYTPRPYDEDNDDMEQKYLDEGTTDESPTDEGSGKSDEGTNTGGSDREYKSPGNGKEKTLQGNDDENDNNSLR